MTKQKDSAEKAIRDIRRATRRQYSAEEKIRIVLEGLRGEDSIAELCRKEGINQNLYYRWVEGVSGGRQETVGRCYRTRGQYRGSQNPAQRGSATERSAGRNAAGKSSA